MQTEFSCRSGVVFDQRIKNQPGLLAGFPSTARRVTGPTFPGPCFPLPVYHGFKRVPQRFKLIGRNDFSEDDIAVIEQLLRIDSQGSTRYALGVVAVRNVIYHCSMSR